MVVMTPELIKHVMPYYNTYGPHLARSLALLWKLFLAVAGDPHSSGTYVVLDALDECEEKSRNYLFQVITEVIRSKNHNTTTCYLKVLLTSRPNATIQLQLKTGSAVRLKTETTEGRINKDILLFVTDTMDELAEEFGYNLALKRRVQNRLQSGADGSFLWVSLVIPFKPAHHMWF